MDDVVGYTYKADIYCPACTIKEVTDRHSRLKRWSENETSAENFLDNCAVQLNVARYDERSYDSGDFPKVVFRDQAHEGNEEGSDLCGRCGAALADVVVIR
jgi:hypothetical protein